ncbi:hypothetical protein LTR16_002610 [Cryomyces antarcticus]|uniref:LDB19 N-terminal domain-containing protein n=1 Tax=Cryomyces antarcticus TaxID=329879 RepID=A0ABR0M7M6_9PEZI|nr:hypothetical protein LTR39_001196 [Cryomyces antarcticus]KAK5290197.1 hypothetical protein LTR16_002610 [Cryomyces antarcticus]
MRVPPSLRLTGLAVRVDGVCFLEYFLSCPRCVRVVLTSCDSLAQAQLLAESTRTTAPRVRYPAKYALGEVVYADTVTATDWVDCGGCKTVLPRDGADADAARETRQLTGEILTVTTTICSPSGRKLHPAQYVLARRAAEPSHHPSTSTSSLPPQTPSVLPRAPKTGSRVRSAAAKSTSSTTIDWTEPDVLRFESQFDGKVRLEGLDSGEERHVPRDPELTAAHTVQRRATWHTTHLPTNSATEVATQLYMPSGADGAANTARPANKNVHAIATLTAPRDPRLGTLAGQPYTLYLSEISTRYDRTTFPLHARAARSTPTAHSRTAVEQACAAMAPVPTVEAGAAAGTPYPSTVVEELIPFMPVHTRHFDRVHPTATALLTKVPLSRASATFTTAIAARSAPRPTPPSNPASTRIPHVDPPAEAASTHAATLQARARWTTRTETLTLYTPAHPKWYSFWGVRLANPTRTRHLNRLVPTATLTTTRTRDLDAPVKVVFGVTLGARGAAVSEAGAGAGGAETAVARAASVARKAEPAGRRSHRCR